MKAVEQLGQGLNNVGSIKSAVCSDAMKVTDKRAHLFS